MRIIECEQNSPDWYAARLGRVTASNMEKIITPTGEKSTQAKKYQNQLIAEIVTGESAETFKGNGHTERGKGWEQEAADAYALLRGVELQRIGFCVSDNNFVGCSPDRFIGEDGMLEIKTCLSSIMIDYYLNDKLEQEHRPQTQCGLWVCGRKWIDTMLYNPLMKPIIVRAPRNEQFITSMSGMVERFRSEMNEKIAVLQTKGYMEKAA